MHTNLYAANFTEATNYNIHPNENDIRKGKFSMPDVINLFRGFDIEID
jgi:fluoroquinolone resistance protein